MEPNTKGSERTEVPKAVYLVCENCGEEALHHVLKGKIGRQGKVIEGTFRCSRCRAVSRKSIRAEGSLEVPVVISWMDDSSRTSMAMGEDEVVSTGSELIVGGEPVVVTSIETVNGRVKSARGKDISMLWTKKCGSVILKVSLNTGRKTKSYSMEVEPEKEFSVGDVLQFGGTKGRIHSIKTKYGNVRRDGRKVEARNILRLYGTVFAR